MQQTDNLDLELYEATDNANLLDGYNSSMRKIDTKSGQVDTLISALSTTVTGYDARITAAQTAADTADGKAVVADGKAVAAQTDATTAMTNAALALASRFTEASYATQTGNNTQNEVITQQARTYRAKTTDATRDLVITITTGTCADCSTIYDSNNPPVKYTTDINLGAEYPIPYAEVPFEIMWGGFINTSSQWMSAVNPHNSDYAKTHMCLYHCMSAADRSNLDLNWRHIAIGLVANS